MIDLLTDFSQLTDTQKSKIDNIVSVINKSISHAVFESILNNDNITEIDIGIGVLKICRDINTVKYKFIPSNALESSIIKTIENKESLIVKSTEESLINLILETKRSLI